MDVNYVLSITFVIGRTTRKSSRKSFYFSCTPLVRLQHAHVQEIPPHSIKNEGTSVGKGCGKYRNCSQVNLQLTNEREISHMAVSTPVRRGDFSHSRRYTCGQGLCK